MERKNSDLIACARAALFDEPANCDIAGCLPLAQRHGVAHFLFYAIAYSSPEYRPEEALCGSLKRYTYGAMVRETAQQQQVEELYRRFESSGIDCLAVKGIAIKALYPKPELRFMSDIDILIDPSRADDVRQHFEEMGYKVLGFDQGDTDLYLSPEGLPFEIKRTLANEGFNPATVSFLGNLLKNAQPMDGFSHVRRLSNEDHYAYILCHMVKHMLNGGVGLRPVMDVWMCKHRMELDKENLRKLLADLKLTAFAERVEHLAEVWFGNAEELPEDAELGDYILSSGSFGSEEHRVADRMLKGKKETESIQIHMDEILFAL